MEENNIINFDWNGSNISFELSGNVTMINATEMAKPFPGKLVADWSRLKSTKEFLNTLSSVLGISITGLVKTIQRGTPNLLGTWMHEYVAIEFARWLSPRLVFNVIDMLSRIIIQNSKDRVINYDKEITSDYLESLIDFLELNETMINSLSVIHDENSNIRFFFGENLKFTKKELFLKVLVKGDPRMILKTIKLLRYFIEKSDKELVYEMYYILSTILSGIVLDNNYNSKKFQKTYLMKDSNTGYTKIGKAINPKFRERTLQSEKPSISLLAVCESLVESELHKKFESKRIRGEWFNLNEYDISEIIDKYNFNYSLC